MKKLILIALLFFSTPNLFGCSAMCEYMCLNVTGNPNISCADVANFKCKCGDKIY